MVELLSVERLGFSYRGGTPVLEDVSLALESGEFLALLGPNGAGKSTLLRVIAHLLEPQQGSVHVKGETMASITSRERAHRIAFVPQALDAIPEVSVLNFVAQGRYAHLRTLRPLRSADYAAIHTAIEEADLSELKDRPMTSLSGGQRQRALIGRALAQQAELLLVDEPTNALDPEHQLAVLELIARLTCRGRAALVVTHDLNLASQFATRIALLDQGRICANGPASSVLLPEVLEPVYGKVLGYATWNQEGRQAHPVVLPWRGAGADRPGSGTKS